MRYYVYLDGDEIGIDGWAEAVSHAQGRARSHNKKAIIAEIRPVISYELDYKKELLSPLSTGVDLSPHITHAVEQHTAANHIPDEEYRLCLEPGNKYWVEHNGEREMMICHEVDGKKLLWDGYTHYEPEDFKIIQGY